MNKFSVKKRITSMLLALTLIITGFTMVKPQEVNAAYSFKSTGSSKLTLTTGEAVFVKYKATKNGYLKFTCKDDADGNGTAAYVTMYKSNKKTALSSADYISSSGSSEYNANSYYAVKKGTTYYFKITPYYTNVNLSTKFYTTKNQGGTKKSKAASMKKNKTYNGTIYAGTNDSDYYKYKVTSSQKLNIYVNAKTNYGLKLKNSGPGVYTNTSNIMYYAPGSHHLSTSGKVKTGTYYIQISGYNKKSTGYYTLKWK